MTSKSDNMPREGTDAKVASLVPAQRADGGQGLGHDGSAGGRPNGNGHINGGANPFVDVDGEADDRSWRDDLPTEIDAERKPTSVYAPGKLRALAKLRDGSIEDYLDLARRLVEAATNKDLTETKLDKAVQHYARKTQKEMKAAADEDGKDDSLAAQLLGWLEEHVDRLFVDDYRRPFLDYRDPATGVFTCRPVGHDDVSDLVISCPILKVAPSPDTVSAVVRTLATRARRSGVSCKVFVRRGWHAGTLYIDRAAPDGSVIEVDKRGVRMIALDACPVRFQYDIAMAELPVPVMGMPIDQLWKFIRVLDKRDRNLVKGALAGFYAPAGPYCGVGFNGLTGASKTTTMEFFASLLDPNKVAPGRMSDSEQNTMILVQRVALLCFDNLTELSEEQSNTLCRLIQGGGFRTRLLYSDIGEVVMQAELPAVVNGISQLITRADLAERFITIMLERIPPHDRKRREEIREAFDAARPELLGTILSAVSSGLARTNFVEPKSTPRMKDHIVWVSRCERGLGMDDGEYLRSFEDNARTGAADVVDSSFLGTAVVHMQESRNGEEWNASPEDTLSEINAHVTDSIRRHPEWPRNAVWLSRRLRPLVPVLEAIGIEVQLNRRPGHARAIIITGPAAPPDPHAKTVVASPGSLGSVQPEIGGPTQQPGDRREAISPAPGKKVRRVF